MLCSFISYAQTKKDSTEQKNIKEVVLVGKKPTVENKVDRTVFNVLTVLSCRKYYLGNFKNDSFNKY
jgi:hypothetical protein